MNNNILNLKNENIIVDIGAAGGFPFVVSHDISSSFRAFGANVIEVTQPQYESCIGNDYEVRFRILMNNSINSLEGRSRFKTLSWMQDNPFQIGNRGECDDPLQYFLCADGDHVEEAAYWFDAANPAIHVPHWASTITPINLDSEYIERSFHTRPIGLLFVGSVSLAKIDEMVSKLKALHPKLQQFASGVGDLIRSGDGRSITAMGVAVDETLGLGLYSENRNAFRVVLSYVDTYFRMENRARLFRALEGVDLAVVTNDISDVSKLVGRGAKLLSGTGHQQKSDPFLLGLYAMCHSKLMINNLPNYRNGVTERFFNAQIRGCAVLSERNAYLEREFEDGVDVFLYDPFDLKDIKERILHILNDDQKLKEVAMAGFEKTRSRHLIENRVQQILSLH